MKFSHDWTILIHDLKKMPIFFPVYKWLQLIYEPCLVYFNISIPISSPFSCCKQSGVKTLKITILRPVRH